MSIDINKVKEDIKRYDRKELYRQKVKKVQAEMASRGLDGLICFKPQNTFFLSGFNPILYSHPVVVIVPSEGEAVLLVHSLRANHSADEAALEDIRLFGMWADQKPIANDAYSAIGIIFEDLIIDRIGITEELTLFCWKLVYPEIMTEGGFAILPLMMMFYCKKSM